MSRLDEPVDAGSLVFSARLTVEAHDDGRGCQCCTPNGCKQDQWARHILAEHTQTTPTRRPAA